MTILIQDCDSKKFITHEGLWTDDVQNPRSCAWRVSRWKRLRIFSPPRYTGLEAHWYLHKSRSSCEAGVARKGNPTPVPRKGPPLPGPLLLPLVRRRGRKSRNFGLFWLV